MATEDKVEAKVEPEVKPEVKAEPEVKVEAKPEAEAKDEAKPEVKVEAKPEAKPSPAGEDKSKPDWRDRRISQLTAQLRQKAPEPEVKLTPALDPTKDFNDRVAAAASEQARVLAAQTDFNNRCNDAASKGQATYGKDKFNERLGQIFRVVGLDPAHPELLDPTSLGQYNELLLAAIETGEAPRLLFELGSDPEEVSRVLALTPRKMAIELTKMSLKDPVADVSELPKPITPVDAKGARHEEIKPSDADRADLLDTPTWMARREEQVKAARAR